MGWPLSQDYNEAIQDPAASFGDADLKQGQAATNALGIPMPRSGNFADVYEVTTPRGKWAVKCFTRQIPGLRERYREVSAYLKQTPLPFMVEFTYLEQGIRVRGDWYPVLKMNWVEGFNLNQFVKDNLERPQLLDILCQIWVKLAAKLREEQIAHCDLQHGNVLLVPGSKAGALAVKLVDYDGMCVPALTMLKTIEAGHPNFQHPQRARDGIYSLEVDRFSHLVIYTAIRALMTGGKSLWAKYDNGDNLLFKASDFEKPTQSPLFAELTKFTEPGVPMLTDHMLQALHKPLDDAPLLEELAPKLPAMSLPKPKTAVKTTKTEDVFAQATTGGRKSQLGKKKKSMAGLALAGVVGVLALIGAGVAALFLMQNNEKPPDQPEAKAPTDPGLPTPPRETPKPKDTGKKDTKKPPNPPNVPEPPQPREPGNRFEPLSLKTVATCSSNRIFLNWRDHFIELPAWGKQKVADIPFDLANPKIVEKNLVCLFTPEGDVARQMPGSVVLPCDSTATAIHLLTASAWSFPAYRDRTVTMVVRLIYTNGAKEDHELVNGVHLTDWFHNVEVEGSTRVLLQANRHIRLITIHPKRAEAIRNIEFTRGNNNSSSAVLGVTIERWSEKPTEPVVAAPGELRRFTGHTNHVRRLAFSRDGRRLLSAALDRSARVWDVETASEVRGFGEHEHDHVYACSFSPDGRFAFSGGNDRTVRQWDVETGQAVQRFTASNAIWHLAVSPTGDRLAACGPGGVWIWDVTTGAELRRFEGHFATVAGVAFQRDGHQIVTASHDRSLRVWDVLSGRQLRSMWDHAGCLQCIAVSADGRHAVTSGDDGRVYLWNVERGWPLRVFNGHRARVLAVAFTPDGRRLLSGAEDFSVRLWDLATGEQIYRYTFPDAVQSIAVHPDGKRFAVSTAGKEIHLCTLPESKEPAAPDCRVAVPDEASLKDCEKEMRAKFEGPFQAEKPEEIHDLAFHLLLEGQTCTGPAAERYVYLREARALAERVRDAEMAVQAIDILEQDFAIDGLKLKAEVLEKLAPGQPATALRGVVHTILGVVQQATKQERFDVAEACLKLAAAAAGTLRLTSVTNLVNKQKKDVELARQEFERVKPMRDKLADAPDDPKANLAVGRYRCFVQGRWDDGLPLLARGSDTKVKELARKEMALPADPDDQEKLGDEWKVLAAKDKIGAAPLYQRAYYWYRYALPGSPRLSAAQRKIAEIDKALSTAPLVLLHGTFGADERWPDATAKFQALASPSSLFVTNANDLKMGDPYFGKQKSMMLLYRKGGDLYFHVDSCDRYLSVPGPLFETHVNLGSPPTTMKFQVLYAAWGGFDHWVDYTIPVRKRVNQEELSIGWNDLPFPDVCPSVRKTLAVVYTYRGKLYVGTLGQGEPPPLTLPAKAGR
jgi:WD40 repeat protein